MVVRILLITVMVMFGSVAAAHDIAYITGTTAQTWDAMPAKPARGVPYVHPRWNTTIVRLTDQADRNGGYMTGLRYTKFSPENCNGTLALLRSPGTTGGWSLYNVDITSPSKYSFIRYVDMANGTGLDGSDTCEPRWDATDPNKLYFVNGMKFFSYDVTKAYNDNTRHTLIRDFSSDFPTGTGIFTDDEGDSSSDSRYWFWIVMIGGARAKVFCYDKTNNTINFTLSKHATYDCIVSSLGCHGPVNWTSMSPDGRAVIAVDGSDVITINTVSFDVNGGDAKIVGTGDGVWVKHGALISDYNGNGLFSANNLMWSTPIDCTVGLGLVYLDQSHAPECLVNYGAWCEADGSVYCIAGSHVGYSSPVKPGWAITSMDSTRPSCRTDSQNPYYCRGMLLLVESSYGSAKTVWQVGPTYSGLAGSYNASPHAVMNRLGTRIYFKSLWVEDGTTGIPDTGNAAYPLETYIVELPTNWYCDLAGRNCGTGTISNITIGPGVSIR